ncbi:MAG: MBL fold metallo-hydrolase [Eubacteriaceae bacterium]|nr:MBL fold metallo-hydrolase [Eubacteriaceae bacterium]
MYLEFCSFSSGSSGNSYMIRTDETVLLVDCGISGKKIFAGLDSVGLEPEDVNGILITHEHSDHVKSLRIVAKKSCEAITYSNISTWQYIAELVPEERQVTFISGDSFVVGDIEVHSFSTSHDAADSVGYSFRSNGRQISIVTDTGYVSEDIFEEIKDADLLALEANHDVDVLRMCRYPYQVKRRILSDEGHLSNEAAGECICRLVEENDKERQILLSHLSRENNTPEMAEITIKNILEEAGIHTGGRLKMDVVVRDKVSPVYQV